MENNFDTPILFIVFNRLNTTQRTFAAIKRIRPKHLFIAADGPRSNRPGEKEICEDVRKYILNGIDWDCKVSTLFREDNLGCGRAVSSAITWFFDNVQDGIILEDDCLPNSSFFTFCTELLKRYRGNKRVMHISGTQFIPNFDNGASYYFAKWMHCWGWASWADRWRYYDLELQGVDDETIGRLFHQYGIRSYILNIVKMLRKKQIDTWDYQWALRIVKEGGLCINPSKNLVTNIGYGGDSTHTLDENSPTANMPAHEIIKIVHPSSVEVDEQAVDYLYQHHLGIDFSPDVVMCKICRAKSKKVFRKKILRKYNTSYYRCTSCGFMQTDTPHWLEEAYSGVNHTDVGLVQRNIQFSNAVENILLTGIFDETARFLDFAGGFGVFARIMRDKGFDFYRADKYCENLFAKHFDIQDLPEQSRRFELITAFELMEHVENPSMELDRIFSMTDNFLFSTELVPDKDVENWWYLGTEHGQHVSFYTNSSLEKIAAKYGKYLYSNGVLHLISNKRGIQPFKQPGPSAALLDKINGKMAPQKIMKSKTWDDYLFVVKKTNK